MAKKCICCGREINDDTLFCRYCGFRQDGKEEEGRDPLELAAILDPVVYEQENAQSKQHAVNNGPESQPKVDEAYHYVPPASTSGDVVSVKKTHLIIIALAALILIAALIGVIMHQSTKSADLGSNGGDGPAVSVDDTDDTDDGSSDGSTDGSSGEVSPEPDDTDPVPDEPADTSDSQTTQTYDKDHVYAEYDKTLAEIKNLLDTGECDWEKVPGDTSAAIFEAQSDDIFYALKDLNGDGTEELVLGYMMNGDGNINVCGFCTIKDGSLYLPEAYMFGQILADGTMHLCGSPFAQQKWHYIRLGANGALEEAAPSSEPDMEFDWTRIS